MTDDPLEHIVHIERDENETRWGVTYCRRCGRVVVNDKYPDKEVKPCRKVQIGFRSVST